MATAQALHAAKHLVLGHNAAVTCTVETDYPQVGLVKRTVTS